MPLYHAICDEKTWRLDGCGTSHKPIVFSFIECYSGEDENPACDLLDEATDIKPSTDALSITNLLLGEDMFENLPTRHGIETDVLVREDEMTTKIHPRIRVKNLDTPKQDSVNIRQGRWWLPHFLFAVVLLGALGLHLYHLDHLYITSWDESVHAIVAEHVEQNPFVPTLYSVQALPPADLTHWDSVHYWLHILPFGMWMAGLSMKVLGDIPFAMRLPGVIFMVIGMSATYFLGRRLFGGMVPGLIGAFVVGFGPLALAMNQGNAFGDMTDTPLIGLTPLLVLAAVTGWQTGKLRWMAVAGIIQGCLYLSKGALGLAPLAIVVALYASDLLFQPEAGWQKMGWRGLLTFFGATALIIVPFYLYINSAFPQTMAVENQNWHTAFFSNYEGWGAPIDYQLTTYFYLMYGTALAFLLVCGALVVGLRTCLRQSRADLVLIVWILAVYIPITLAVTKSPPMGIPALAAFGLAVGRFIQLTVLSRKRVWQILGLGVLCGTAAMTIILMVGQTFHGTLISYDLTPEMINPSVAFYKVVALHSKKPYTLEILFSGGFVLLCASIFIGVDRLRKMLGHGRVGDVMRQQRYRIWSMATFIIACALLGIYVIKMDVAFVTRPLVPAGPAPIVGPYIAQHTTPNTTILMDDGGFTYDTNQAYAKTPFNGHDNLMVMYWAHRDTYTAPGLDTQTLCPIVAKAAQLSSPVVLVTQHVFNGVAIGSIDGWTLYRLAPCP